VGTRKTGGHQDHENEMPTDTLFSIIYIRRYLYPYLYYIIYYKECMYWICPLFWNNILCFFNNPIRWCVQRDLYITPILANQIYLFYMPILDIESVDNENEMLYWEVGTRKTGGCQDHAWEWNANAIIQHTINIRHIYMKHVQLYYTNAYQ
jgi:hypothetical protein